MSYSYMHNFRFLECLYTRTLHQYFRLRCSLFPSGLFCVFGTGY